MLLSIGIDVIMIILTVVSVDMSNLTKSFYFVVEILK